MSELSLNDTRWAGRRHWWLLAGVLMGVYLLVRVPGMMALPIFGDEAIYLRWAQFARRGDFFRSLIDPKPPLHFWLIGGFLGVAEDPLKVARGLSVVAGLLTIPALLALCGQMERLIREPVTGFARRDASKNEAIPPTGWSVGLVAAVLMIFCPFLAFYQRLGLADAWVVLEGVVILWLGLKVAGEIWETADGKGRRGLWGVTVGLGVAMGAALMTRQIVSYLFPVIVCAGFVLLWEREKPWPRAVGRFLAHMAVAGVIALALWTPFWTGWPAGYHAGREAEGAVTANSVRSEIRLRFLYQTNFSEALTVGQRVKRAGSNLKMIFVPSGKVGDADYATGWLWVYLTPGVLLLSAAGAVWLGVRRQWRALGFLAGWFLLLMGPLVVFGDVAYSRYALVAVPPLLIVAAYLAVDALGWVAQRGKIPAVTWATGAVLAGLLLVLPARDVAGQSSKWWEQPLVKRDRYQYVTGWTSGLGSRLAIAYIKELAASGPVVVITRADEWGNPADALWAYLEATPNVTLYCVDRMGAERAGGGEPVLRAAGEGRYWLRPEKWSYRKAEAVALDPKALVVVALNHPVHIGDNEMPADEFFSNAGNRPAELRIFPFGRLQTKGGEGEQVLLLILGTVEEIQCEKANRGAG